MEHLEYLDHIFSMENVVLLIMSIKNFLVPWQIDNKTSLFYLLSIIYYFVELVLIFFLIGRRVSLLQFIHILTLINAVLFHVFLHYISLSKNSDEEYSFDNVMIWAINFLLFSGCKVVDKLLKDWNTQTYPASIQDIKFQKECLICLEEMIDNRQEKELLKYKCGHVFDKICLMDYQIVSKQMKCPVCR
jgi:hypothetical protein